MLHYSVLFVLSALFVGFPAVLQDWVALPEFALGTVLSPSLGVSLMLAVLALLTTAGALLNRR